MRLELAVLAAVAVEEAALRVTQKLSYGDSDPAWVKAAKLITARLKRLRR